MKSPQILATIIILVMLSGGCTSKTTFESSNIQEQTNAGLVNRANFKLFESNFSRIRVPPGKYRRFCNILNEISTT